MALPTTRTEFKEYCLRALGKPVVTIDVTDAQVDDRLDYALKYYWDYHFDGAEKVYYKHIVTAEDKTNGYITMPENINGVVRIFDIGFGRTTAGNMFNLEYQIALNDLYSLTHQSMIPYFMTRQHLALLESLLVGQQPIRYNRHTDKLYVDTNWDKFPEGSYLIVEAYQVIDPEVYTDAYADRWLLNYVTQLVKKQWGTNLGKFQNVQLLGGVTFNGEQIYQQADQEIQKLESEMLYSYSLPVYDMLG